MSRKIFIFEHCSKMYSLKETHRESALPNKTQEVTKSMNIEIWLNGTLNQLFKICYFTLLKFSKK